MVVGTLGVLSKDSTKMKNNLGGPPPAIVTTRNSKDYIRVILYSYYTTITGWGVLLRNNAVRVF